MRQCKDKLSAELKTKSNSPYVFKNLEIHDLNPSLAVCNKAVKYKQTV